MAGNCLLSSLVTLNVLADISVMDFIKYNGTYGGSVEGKVSAELGHQTVNTDLALSGKDSSKLQSALGSLRKEEVDMQKLLRDCKDRFVPCGCRWSPPHD